MTVELTQARANPAPAREAWGTRQGPATDKEGTLLLGCPLLPSFLSVPPSSVDHGFSAALSPGTGPKHSRTLDTLVGFWETMISGRAVDLSQDATWGREWPSSILWQDPGS